MLKCWAGSRLPSIPTSPPSLTNALIIQGTRFLHTLPCHTIDGDDNSVVGDAVEIVLQDFSSATHDDLPSDADNAVSSDDDDARMVLLSELLQSSPVPAFNPDRAPAAGASSDFLLFLTTSSP